jgi:hypothetical protein
MLMVVGVVPSSVGQPAAGDVAAALVTVASEHEMVVVHASSRGPHEVVAAMRMALPRFHVVGLINDPEAATAADDALIDGLLADGAIPVLVVPDHTVQASAMAEAERVSADALIWLFTDERPAAYLGSAPGGIRLELAVPHRRVAA